MHEHRLNRLDHLRGIAALSVALWHFKNAALVHPVNHALSVFQQGHTGVSLFCVLSGFIFTWLYRDTEINAREFAIKRVFRILPLFLVVLALSLYTTPGADATKAFVSLITTIYQPGAFVGYISPGWSVLIELQFYAAFIPIVLIARKAGPVYLLLAVGLLLLIRALVFVHTGSVQGLSYQSMFGRGDQFLAGMAAAIVARRWDGLIDRTMAMAGGALGIAGIMFFYSWFSRDFGGFYAPASSNSPAWIVLPTVEAVCYAAILLGYLALPNFPAQPLDAIAGYLGRISYSIYLVHILAIFGSYKLIEVMKIETPTTWEGHVVIFSYTALPIIIMLSSATYFLIEAPMIRVGQAFLRR